MIQEHPITPPPELIAKWAGSMCGYYEAARWGADQELEACIECLLADHWQTPSRNLRAARRPKPSSHKELALIALTALEACAAQSSDTTESVFYIRRALESLPD